MEIHHEIWCKANAKTSEWLAERIKEGFHVHHIDGHHENNDPKNLVLIWGSDHVMLHSGRRINHFAVRARKIYPCGCRLTHRKNKKLATCDGKVIAVSSFFLAPIADAYHQGKAVNGVLVL